jgi:hypothetical protein
VPVNVPFERIDRFIAPPRANRDQIQIRSTVDFAAASRDFGSDLDQRQRCVRRSDGEISFPSKAETKRRIFK